jgi:hypothetical protein
MSAPVAIIRGEWDSICRDADARWPVSKEDSRTPNSPLHLSSPAAPATMVVIAKKDDCELRHPK